ncbi:TonB-linked outer membrane protein, SusC/RagA family [Lutibacter oricola]|uniref:TonB-linked outer membrane protein, SusC/RagA family n=1 Tax=Lutibacter oricola TaxID=762486 RepID=A0A1H2YZE9_9FLAO|nr:TonB-dependent receptor [Lutibacter oricola]SDX10451.1 TonB-linked outer membrane protein, SusC/RagA family [Lutibacter oricola]
MKFNLLVNWKLKTFLLAIMLVFGFSTMQAQTVTVKGTVTGEDQPLPGVSVLVKGTSNGTVTDFDGNYEIKAKSTDVLLFSYIGFAAREIKINGKTTLNVVLKTDVAALDEVVVIGYGTQRKKEVTGAVVKVEADELAKTATSDVGSALQGQVAGVSVVASSGEPGAEANILIRGVSSVYGSNKPLYVVDGIPFEDDPKLSVNEIESIDVLKDAASAAIYGTRGSAGVILITTKKGKEGSLKVSANGYYGVQNITSSTYLLNREDKIYLHFLMAANDSSPTYYGNTWHSAEQNPTQLTNDTNLMNYILNDGAPVENYNLMLSGGKAGLTYSVAGNFFKQEGTVLNSNYERFNVRANTRMKKDNWTIDSGISFRVEDRKYAPWGILRDAYRYSALQTDLSESLEDIADAGNGATDSAFNNLSNVGRKLIQNDTGTGHFFDGRISIAYEVNPNLRLTTRASAGWTDGGRITINPEFVAYDWEGDPIPTEQSKIYNQSTTSEKYSWENIINWKKSFGDHNVNLTGVYSAEKYSYSSFYGAKFDIFNNDITTLNGATGDAQAGSGTGQWGQDRVNTLIGMLARLQYNYKGKYLLSASVRRDGSSRFGDGNKWGNFPSFSAGWNVSDEPFWEPIKNVVSSFKLRGSYGTTGNQGIEDYFYSSTIVLEHDYVFGAEGNQTYNLGATQIDYANELVKWETSISQNVGFDLSLLNNSLTISGDLYSTEKEDMLFSVFLPPSTGVGLGNNSDIVLNVGNMENKGMELAVNYKDRKGKVKWNAGLNFSKNTNEVTKMSGTNDIIYFDSEISGHNNDQDDVSVLAEGYGVGSFFLIKTDGVIQTQEELDSYLAEYPTSGAALGDLRLLDALTEDTDGDGVADAGDGVIDINDRQYMGSGTPEWELGFNASVRYSNFDLSAQVFGAFGGKIMNGSKAYAYQYGNHQDFAYQWSPQNPTSEIPVFRGIATHNNVRGRNDYYMEDGDYVRLRNITLGYSLPKKVLEKLSLSKLRLYVAGQNLITITDYTGYDPEVGNNGFSTRGIDKGTYPVTSQVRAGVQLEF